MSFLSRLLKSGKPNVARLKEKRDLAALRAAMSYSGSSYSGSDDLADILRINASAAKALGELRDSQALPDLHKQLAELASLEKTINEIQEIVTGSAKVRQQCERNRAAIRETRSAIREAIKQLS